MKELIQTIDDANFDVTISQGTCLIDFSAEWCGPCKTLHPVLEQLAEAVQGQVAVGKIDIDKSPKTTQKFQITSVPTLILFKNGKETNRVVGLKDLETLKKITLS